MSQGVIPSSIMFKNVLEPNKAVSDKVSQAKPRIHSLLDLASWRERRELCLITLQLADFHLNFAGNGMDAGLECLNICLEEATAKFQGAFSGCRLVLIQEASPGDFILVFEHEAKDRESLFEAYLSYRLEVVRAASLRIHPLTGSNPDILIGFSALEPDKAGPGNKFLFQAICKAKRLSQQKIDSPVFSTHAKMCTLLSEDLNGVVYQPVVDLGDGRILGWEAYARSRTGINVQDALRCFELTGSTSQTMALERDLWRMALAGAGNLDAGYKLFLNVSPACLTDPDSNPADFARLAAEHGFSPRDIVLEFSDKLSPGELAVLPEKLDAYRAQKFLTAVDDVGAGNSNLMLLARFSPDYIKADVSLIKDIESNPFKRVMLETLVLMAEKTGALVIAEGVETELALSTLVSIGVHAGQGFYLAPPAYPRPDVLVEIPLKASFRQAAAGKWKCSAPVGDLINPCLIVEPSCLVSEVKELLADKPPMSSVVVAEADRPRGLLMNYNLDKVLSAKFGIDLYHKKQVSKLMDRSPLLVEFGTPIEEAARLAMNRDPGKIYDDIVVVRDGALIGTVSVQKMLDTLAKVQVELAKGSNPLTGLPGNVAIEQEFNRRAREGIPSSMIYVDLDHFKVYNDVYGFNQGDKIILLSAQVLRDAVAAYGRAQDFVGHVGGDDFVVISAKDSSEAITRAVIDVFAAEAPKFYTAEDREKGYIHGKNREGQEQQFPLVSMSIGILDCDFQTAVTFEELSSRVAEVKKFAKSKPGNSCVRDRRAPLGAAANVSGIVAG